MTGTTLRLNTKQSSQPRPALTFRLPCRTTASFKKLRCRAGKQLGDPPSPILGNSDLEAQDVKERKGRKMKGKEDCAIQLFFTSPTERESAPPCYNINITLCTLVYTVINSLVLASTAIRTYVRTYVVLHLIIYKCIVFENMPVVGLCNLY